MKCPTCGHILIVVEYDGIEVDHCQKCGGVWLDKGELELLIEKEYTGVSIKPTSLRQEGGNFFRWFRGMNEERRRLCPVCGRKMRKVTVMGVIIDECNKDGLWLDAGELNTIIEGFSGEDSELNLQHVSNHLGKMFGKDL
jgi:Zn-finger nucleic acid-binding protein